MHLTFNNLDNPDKIANPIAIHVLNRFKGVHSFLYLNDGTMMSGMDKIEIHNAK